MAASKARDLATVAALYLALIAGGIACLVAQSQPTGYAGGGAEWPEISDRPLLTAEQIAQARETGSVAFECAGRHYVASGIPTEYLAERQRP